VLRLVAEAGGRRPGALAARYQHDAQGGRSGAGCGFHPLLHMADTTAVATGARGAPTLAE
jgi:hypothetical protein